MFVNKRVIILPFIIHQKAILGSKRSKLHCFHYRQIPICPTLAACQLLPPHLENGIFKSCDPFFMALASNQNTKIFAEVHKFILAKIHTGQKNKCIVSHQIKIETVGGREAILVFSNQ